MVADLTCGDAGQTPSLRPAPTPAIFPRDARRISEADVLHFLFQFKAEARAHAAFQVLNQ